MMRGVTWSVGLVALTAAVLVGCSGHDSATQDGDRRQAPTAQQRTPEARAGIPDATSKAAIQALETASEHINDGVAFGLAWKSRDEGAWHVDVMREESSAHEVMVSADGSEVLNSDASDKAGHSGDIANAVDATVDAAKVVRTATDDHSGAVDELEVSHLGDGTPVWRITLDDGGERTRYVFSTDTGDEISSQRDKG